MCASSNNPKINCKISLRTVHVFLGIPQHSPGDVNAKIVISSRVKKSGLFRTRLSGQREVFFPFLLQLCGKLESAEWRGFEDL